MSHEMHSLKSFRDQGVPEPRKRRRTSLGYILFSLFVTLLGIVVMAGLALFYGNRQMLVEGPLSESKSVHIERGMSTKAIAARLYDERIISNERIFFLAALVNKKLGGSLKAGEYEFAARDSMRQVLDKVSTGEALVHKVTIPEGLTSQQVLLRLAALETLSGDLPQVIPEGSVLPDTYVFNRGMDRQALLAKMQSAQTKLLDDLWDKRLPGLPVKTKQEALILASIVEKETGVAAERPRVAAVFHNRLMQNIRLQSDPTIIYGIVGGKGALDRPLRRSDIDARTAYNTYQIDGLPPTPITNPGRDAIAAVLKPASVEDLYFVADGTGGHVFAKTLAEHNKNVPRLAQDRSRAQEGPRLQLPARRLMRTRTHRKATSPARLRPMPWPAAKKIPQRRLRPMHRTQQPSPSSKPPGRARRQPSSRPRPPAIRKRPKSPLAMHPGPSCP